MDCMLPLFEYRKVALSQSVECVVAFRLIRSCTSARYTIKTLSSGLRLELKCVHSESNFDLAMHKLMIYLPAIEKVLCFKYYNVLLYTCSLQFAYSVSNGGISWDCSLLVEFVNAISF